MKFFNDGAVNFPYLSDGMWFLTQHKRWGLMKQEPDYLAVAKEINKIDIYKEAASQVKVNVPKDPMRSSKLMDGVVWDGKNPAVYAKRIQDTRGVTSEQRNGSGRRTCWPQAISLGQPGYARLLWRRIAPRPRAPEVSRLERIQPPGSPCQR
jgi:hypothetical protein